MKLDKLTLLHAADVVHGLILAGHGGEIEESLRRLATKLPNVPPPEAITLSEDRIREFAKPVADRHAARLGVAIGSGTLYHTLLLDVGDAIKKAVEFMNKERP